MIQTCNSNNQMINNSNIILRKILILITFTVQCLPLINDMMLLTH